MRYIRRLEPLYGVLVGLALVLLVLGAGYVRGSVLWPQSQGLRESPYDDEGVYALAAQLLVQNKHPYRDYIYAHPPLGPLFLLPGVEYRFTAWGSPTSLINLRYLMLAYSALTVGLASLIAWRLWGLGGGLLAGVLLALDPASVWTGRHVMLEAPTLFLAALAALLYVLARDHEPAPGALLVGVGFCAALAGSVKLPGFLLLVAFALDLLARRRWGQLGLVFTGAAILGLPLLVYLAVLRGGEPLNQFVWFQALRPPDGETAVLDRLSVLRREVWLTLLGAAFGVVGLALALRRPRRRRRRRRWGEPGAVRLRTMSDLLEGPAAERSRAADGASGATTAAPGAPPILEEPRPPVGPGWTLLLWWLGLTMAALLLSRTFYAHYGALLTLPLAILGGALLAAVRSVLDGNWPRRALGAALLVAAVVALGPVGYRALQDDRRPSEDRIYELVGRYAGDAAGPEESVFALDAQYPFRAARRPAREAGDRFVVDGYAMLLYHGLALDGQSSFELARRALGRRPPTDPYEVMWRGDAQVPLRLSLEGSNLVVLDDRSDARLTDETRDRLRARAQLLERQARYSIYRVTNPGPQPVPGAPGTPAGPGNPATPTVPAAPTAPTTPTTPTAPGRP